MNQSSPQARLERLRKRAEAYSDVEQVAVELHQIEQSIGNRQRSDFVDKAILALERGLDLLDTGRYLPTLQSEAFRKRELRSATAISNARRAKLPPGSALLAELNAMLAEGLRRDIAMGSIVRKYKGKATRRGIESKIHAAKKVADAEKKKNEAG